MTLLKLFLKRCLGNCKHGIIVLAYALLYMGVFNYLEQREVPFYHIVHTALDDVIPFCEVFIIPYLFWFFYILLAVLYFIFREGDHREYYRMVFHMMTGMTIFLIVSYLYPNAQQLRPTVFPRDNIFTYMVKELYSRDTPTNILPSIHVFNSLAIHIAITTSEKLRDKKAIKIVSLVITTLIILSTMFLKQHSVIDVFLGMTMALLGYQLFYVAGVNKEHARRVETYPSSRK